MKKELAALELHYLVEELQVLTGAKMNSAFQQDDSVLLDFHKTGKGRVLVRALPKFLFITRHKGVNPQSPPSFCVFLRKQLNNARLMSITQVGAERIVEFLFEKGAEKKVLKLYVELFGKGNILLTDEAGMILKPLHVQRWSDRTVKTGVVYIYPRKELNMFEISLKEIEQLKESSSESLVKALASDLGLGGVYAEETCLQAKVDKNVKPKDLSAQEIKKIYATLQDLVNHAVFPVLYKKDGWVKNIVPFPLDFYEKQGFSPEKVSLYNTALDEAISQGMLEVKEKETEKVKNKALHKADVMIDAQEKTIAKMQKLIDENQQKGELLYSNYQLIEGVLSQLKEVRKKHSWKEIKKKLKGHDLIKEVNEKESSITVEL
jgi:predicted ribosome quality control (RQC) complex YloA/Tae2 family protein